MDKTLNFKVLDSMATVVDNVLECISIEICKEKINLVISCLYSAPGSNIEVLKDWVEYIFSKKGNKTIVICGVFNIDLLNPNKHKMIDEFINTMYSMTYYPIITT